MLSFIVKNLQEENNFLTIWFIAITLAIKLTRLPSFATLQSALFLPCIRNCLYVTDE